MGFSDYEKRHGELEAIRRREEPTWRNLARFLQPDSSLFDVNSKTERDGSDDPYDSTALYALDDFVGGMFVKANNPAERWFSYTLGLDKALAQYRPVKQWLRDFEDVTYASLDPSRDNFYLAAPAWFAGAGAFGTGHLWQEEVVGAGEIMSVARPIGEIFKDVDANGNLMELHRKFTLTGLQAKREYGGLAPQMRDDESAVFIQALARNDDYRPGAIGPRGKPITSCAVSPDKRNFFIEGMGFNEWPVHEIEWSKRSGRAWATGPGHNALADMRGNDELTRSALVAAQRDAEPMYLVQNENIMTTSDIIPDNVLYGGISDGGKRMVEMLERRNPPQLTLNERQEVRAAIRRAFRFGLAAVLGSRPQMTAEEVLTYKAEDLKMLAPNLVRIHRGFGGFLSRRASILMRMNRVPPPPPELLQRGAQIVVQFESPFAKAQQAETAQGVLKWVNTKVTLFEATQDPNWTDDVDVDGVSAVLHEAMTNQPSVKLDPRQVKAKRDARAAAQQQQAGLEQESIAADVQATRAHAAQASSKAAERRSVR